MSSEQGAGRPRASILVLTPSEGDAEAVSHVLFDGGFQAEICADMSALAGAVAREPAAIILAQEALAASWDGDGRMLARALHEQPEWSDLPIILLATPGSSEMGAWEHARALDPVGNISILERPLRRTTLLNAVAVAIRARERQYRLRASLVQREDMFQRLRQSERTTRTLTDNAPEILARFDRNHRHVFVSAAITRATGLDPESFIGKTNQEMGMQPHLCELWDGTIAAVFRTGETRTLDFSFDSVEGKRWFTAQVVAERGVTGEIEHVISSCTDITERKAVEQELARHRDNLELAVQERTAELAASNVALHNSERLASLGTLAVGLGHDIANLTLPIRARLEALHASCNVEDAQEDFSAISKALDHLSNLSAGMRLMAMDPDRIEASTPASDLAAWCSETSQVWRATLGRHIKLECHAPSGVGVSVPRHRLAQAVFNLVQNAGEAMANQPHGTVWVNAEAATGPKGEPIVYLTVRDDGPGMPPEVVARCFEPYYSTKGRAIATGMGLSMVRGIVESVGGTVTVKTAPGQGTTFTLTLPALTQGAATSNGPPRTAAVSVHNERTAALAFMFLGQMAFTVSRHPATSMPDTSLWVVEAGEPSLVGAYLSQHPEHRVVLLNDGAHPGHTPASGTHTRKDACIHTQNGRVVKIGLSPTPGVLRDAISTASRVDSKTT